MGGKFCAQNFHEWTKYFYRYKTRFPHSTVAKLELSLKSKRVLRSNIKKANPSEDFKVFSMNKFDSIVLRLNAACAHLGPTAPEFEPIKRKLPSINVQWTCGNCNPLYRLLQHSDGHLVPLIPV